MRRGIATFAFLAHLALATLVSAVLSAAMLALLFSRPAQAPPEARRSFVEATGSREPWSSHRFEIRGLVLAPQNLPGATLTDCRLVGEWRGSSLHGARLWECDLSQAALDNGTAFVLPFPGPDYDEAYPADLRGALYDVHTRWPAGFNPRAHGAKLVERGAMPPPGKRQVEARGVCCGKCSASVFRD